MCYELSPENHSCSYAVWIRKNKVPADYDLVCMTWIRFVTDFVFKHMESENDMRKRTRKSRKLRRVQSLGFLRVTHNIFKRKTHLDMSFFEIFPTYNTRTNAMHAAIGECDHSVHVRACRHVKRDVSIQIGTNLRNDWQLFRFSERRRKNLYGSLTLNTRCGFKVSSSYGLVETRQEFFKNSDVEKRGITCKEGILSRTPWKTIRLIAWFELSIRRQTNFSDWKCNLSKRNSPTIFFNAPSELEHSPPRAGRRENSIVHLAYRVTRNGANATNITKQCPDMASETPLLQKRCDKKPTTVWTT